MKGYYAAAWNKVSSVLQGSKLKEQNYKQLLYNQVSTRHEKNLSNSSTGSLNAKQWKNYCKDPIGNENQAASIEKCILLDISTLAQSCMQDTIYICCKKLLR